MHYKPAFHFRACAFFQLSLFGRFSFFCASVLPCSISSRLFPVLVRTEALILFRSSALSSTLCRRTSSPSKDPWYFLLYIHTCLNILSSYTKTRLLSLSALPVGRLLSLTRVLLPHSRDFHSVSNVDGFIAFSPNHYVTASLIASTIGIASAAPARCT